MALGVCLKQMLDSIFHADQIHGGFSFDNKHHGSEVLERVLYKQGIYQL